MAALNFLMEGNRKPASILHINHNTGEYAERANYFVRLRAEQYSCDYYDYKAGLYPGIGSKEEHWRNQRYAFFDRIQVDSPLPIILAHNLDDCVEQYISNRLIRPRRAFTISYRGPSNTIRPFRTWKKTDIREYLDRQGLPSVEDPSNRDTAFTRNKIRHEVIPKLLEMNPGLYRFVTKGIMEEAKKEKDNLVL